MKKILSIIVITILVVFGNSLVFADNSAKIAELTAKQQECINKINQAQQFIQQQQSEALKIQGKIEMLTELDAPKIEEKK